MYNLEKERVPKQDEAALKNATSAFKLKKINLLILTK